jgi:hypothetical protein
LPALAPTVFFIYGLEESGTEWDRNTEWFEKEDYGCNTLRRFKSQTLEYGLADNRMLLLA